MSSSAEGLLGILAQSPAGGPAFVESLRDAGRSSLRAKGLPGRKDEAWRFTSVRDLAKGSFDVVQPATYGAGLVRSTLPPGVTVESLADVLARRPQSVEGVLGRHVESEFFTAMNSAMLRDGVVVRVSSGTRSDSPIELVYAAEGSANDSVTNPRVLVVVEDDAEASLVETHVAPSGEQVGRRLTNLVSEVVLGERATLEHVLVHEGLDHHVARLAVHQAGASTYRSRVFTFGGALVRLDLSVVLAGEAASTELDGLYLVSGNEHVDHHVRVVHRAPRCNSRQTYRGVLDESGTAVFDGTTEVEKGAQQTEAHQENRNLLLSDSAVVNTKLHLRIDADDVICSHGATVGSLDREQLFYLRSRGIPDALAHAMLTFAFLRSLVDRVVHEPTRERLAGTLVAKLPSGEGVEVAS